MPATLELEAPVELQNASAHPEVNAGESVALPPNRKSAKKRPGHKRSRSKSASSPNVPHQYTSPLAIAIANPGPKAEGVVAEAADKRFRPKKPMRMGQALRREGIDEHAVAEAWAEVVDMLKGKTEENDDVEKLLVDVLKECSKHLEEDNKAAGPSPVHVKLIHNVARPQHNVAPGPRTAAPAASAAEPARKDPSSRD